ncbi:hypothetical protein [Prevotella sp. OH937_COT-195]|uniref:hypothetical protein n=1 Tax=Prevotella sp. OH937_COT-195 TaxID=2491051 RepID=UPI000F653CD7|nr:hypothetical protein [Prevotella sp. OH937_COT-195]RRC99064.1 hypothetical protein EII32_08505 [Prevotella sp. OH937_COT-195]
MKYFSNYRANDLSGFDFRFAGSGHYRVTYTTPTRGDYWVALITDMTLIDARFGNQPTTRRMYKLNNPDRLTKAAASLGAAAFVYFTFTNFIPGWSVSYR